MDIVYLAARLVPGFSRFYVLSPPTDRTTPSSFAHLLACSRPAKLSLFGDKDGVGDAARLSHPMAVCWLPSLERLCVVDSYNHRLKLVDDRNGARQVQAAAPGMMRGRISAERRGADWGIGASSRTWLLAGEATDGRRRCVVREA